MVSLADPANSHSFIFFRFTFLSGLPLNLGAVEVNCDWLPKVFGLATLDGQMLVGGEIKHNL